MQHSSQVCTNVYVGKMSSRQNKTKCANVEAYIQCNVLYLV